MKVKYSAFLTTLLAIACSSDNPTQPPPDNGPPGVGSWTRLAPLPTPRQEVPHAVLNGLIYVPGGITQGQDGSTVIEVYDPISDTWSTSVPAPEPLHHFGFVAVNGTLFILGGYTGSSFSPTDRVYEFNAQNGDWNRKEPMPGRRGAHVAIAFVGKIYVIGGVGSSGRALSLNQAYDPGTNSWTTLSPMTTAREHLAAAVIDSLIYVVGGRSVQSGILTNVGNLEAYSPSQDRWTSLSNMPTPRGGLAAAAMNGKLYVFGGEFPGVFSENQEYDPASNTWQNMAPMITPRHGMGAATTGNKIFVIGGGAVAGFGVSAANEAFMPSSE